MLLELYTDKVINDMKAAFGYENIMQVPKLTKVCVNTSLSVEASKGLDNVIRDVALITGQKPAVTKARKSIAGFKLRAGMPIGCKVTLRKKKMYEFLERILYIALPRSRDFRGLNPKSFDSRGNYSLGIKEHIIFPEINYGKIDKIIGMDINIVTSAQNDQEALALLAGLGFPFRGK
ncbi:50S ribosomal protein L5 [Rickettsiales bacterium]|nr:50S ribosomal protein L5 [Rickettsiales bacterium]